MFFVEVSLPLGSTEEAFWERLRKKTPPAARKSVQNRRIRVQRCSLDARNHKQIVWRIRVMVPQTGERLPATQGLQAPDLTMVRNQNPHARPVIIGMGPAGLFAALYLARAGLCPIVVEQGQTVQRRQEAVKAFWETGALNPDSNVQFGEGGAGTFSDGKLHTGIRSPWIEQIFQTLVEAGAPPEILWSSQPHIGTDRLPQILQEIRNELQERGADLYFSHRCIRIQQQGQEAIVTLENRDTGAQFQMRAPVVFVATGHSARSLYAALAEEGIAMEAKAFAVGVRIEHPQSFLDEIQYGVEACQQFAAALPPTSYKLVAHTSSGRAVYSFCMCPGGSVIACSSDHGQIVTNGMSEYARDAYHGNSALLVQIRPEDCQAFQRETQPETPALALWWERAQRHPALSPIYFQEVLENRVFRLTGETYEAPVLSVEAFLQTCSHSAGERVEPEGSAQKQERERECPMGPPSYQPGVQVCDFRGIFPEYCIEALQEALRMFGERMPGFDRKDARLYAVESRSSAPLRILRDPQTRRSLSHFCLFPIGEGSGYAGGITSSAVDGVQSAAQYCSDLLRQWEGEEN